VAGSHGPAFQKADPGCLAGGKAGGKGVMKLYLLRHGEAVDIGECGVRTDGERRLTREGRECTSEVIRRVRNVCRPRRIWTSPLVRARETAAIAGEILTPDSPPSVLELLKAGAPPREIASWVRSCREDSLMLVGHMPDLARLAVWLTSGVMAEGLVLKKSGVCCIEFEGTVREKTGRLLWLVSPSLLSRLEP